MSEQLFEKEDNKTYQKRYYQEHKEQHLARLNAKKTCHICGKSVCTVNFPKHLRSKKCSKQQELQSKLKEAPTSEELTKNFFKYLNNFMGADGSFEIEYSANNDEGKPTLSKLKIKAI